MRKRSTAAGILQAEQQFRRIVGYSDLATLVTAIKHRHLAVKTPTRHDPPRRRPPPRMPISSLPSDITIPMGSPSKFHDEPDNVLARAASPWTQT